MTRLVVVGGGIVGLSAARAAVRRGWAVTVLEAGDLPYEHAASHDQHRMIRMHHGSSLDATRLAGAAFGAWDHLWADLGVRRFADVGALAISLRPGDFADATLDSFRRIGTHHELLDAAGIESLCPQFAMPEGARGVLAHPGGILYADEILRDLVRYLAACGADLRPRCPVVGIDAMSGRVGLASGEAVLGDFVVAAVGAWLPELLPDEFGHLPTYRQTLGYVQAPAMHRAGWERSPALVCVGDEDIYALPPVGSTDLKFGHGPRRRAQRPSAGFATGVDEGQAILSAFAPYLRGASEYEAMRVKVGYYTLDPARPALLSRLGRRAVMANCRGQMFKFGPLVGDGLVASLAGERGFDGLARSLASL